MDSHNFQRRLEILDKRRQNLFDKAIKSKDSDLVLKANSYLQGDNFDPMSAVNQFKGFMVDPQQMFSSFDYRDRPTSLTYATLERTSHTFYLNSVIATRIAQVQNFCLPPESSHSVGFKVVLKDAKAKPSKAQIKRANELTDMILETGFSPSWGRENFLDFIGMLVRSSLTYDQYNFEILEDRKGIPQEFIALDASTFRLARPTEQTKLKPDPITGEETYPFYVQIYQDIVENEFYPWELCFGVRRPRTDVWSRGYGLSEIEEMIEIITALIWGVVHNRNTFKQGSMPKGILKLAGNVNNKRLQEFKREWFATLRSVNNSWRVPILQSDKAEWITMSQNNKDMEFHIFLEFLIKLISALFLIDPSETNFDISNGRSAMFNTSNESKVKYSRDKGLKPILRNLQYNLNRNVISRIDPEYCLKFMGVDTESESEALENTIKEVGNFRTLNEVRAKFDYEPLSKENGGDLILNNIYTSWMQQQQIAAQRQIGSEENEQDEQEEMDNDEDNDERDFEYENEEEFQKGVEENPFLKDIKDFLEN